MQKLLRIIDRLPANATCTGESSDCRSRVLAKSISEDDQAQLCAFSVRVPDASAIQQNYDHFSARLVETESQIIDLCKQSKNWMKWEVVQGCLISFVSVFRCLFFSRVAPGADVYVNETRKSWPSTGRVSRGLRSDRPMSSLV